MRGKYAALKSIEFLFRQFQADEVDEAIVALVGFALSLTGVNTTFFKVTGQKSGAPGKVDKFERCQNIILFNVDGDYEPIKIEELLNNIPGVVTNGIFAIRSADKLLIANEKNIWNIRIIVCVQPRSG